MSLKYEVLAKSVHSYETADEFAGLVAGICYMGDDFQALKNQLQQVRLKRAERTKQDGHHSVYCHLYMTLLIEGLPKICAMLLNNLNFYNTSEKSGRYTIMKSKSERENQVYDKWVKLFKCSISEEYPNLTGKQVEKLSLENARNLLSVFVPTELVHTTSIQQWNYIYDWCLNYSNRMTGTDFEKCIAIHLLELAALLESVPELIIKDLRDNKGRTFDALDTSMDIPAEHYGANYMSIYKGTFASYAQAQRHRVLDMVCHFDGESKEFYVPDIIKGTPLEQEWLQDISEFKNNYPIGTLVTIQESGTFDSWVLKAKERACGCAQLEIMQQTKAQLDAFEQNKAYLTNKQRQQLEQMHLFSRCTYKDFTCTAPCIWGAKGTLTRKV